MRPRVIDVVGPLAGFLLGGPFVVAVAAAPLVDDAIEEWRERRARR